MLSKRLILFICLVGFSFGSKAQVLETEKSPKKASLYSAILPGAGQIYNTKYWKVPVLYASIGTAIYIAKWNNSEYLHYREAFEYRTDDDETTVDPYIDRYTESNLVTMKNYHRKNRDLAYIITAGIYLLNILDASVDAHLFNFNVNDNLDMVLKPKISRFQDENQYTLSLTLNLR